MAVMKRETPAQVPKAFRTRTGRSQSDLGEILGVTPQTVIKYERLGGPGWLRHALLGVAVAAAGFTEEAATRFLGFEADGKPSGTGPGRRGANR